MLALPRIIFSMLGGSLAGLMLLWLMQWLVMSEQNGMFSSTQRPVMEFVRLKKERSAQVRERQLPEPEPPPPEVPPVPPVPTFATTPLPVTMPEIDLQIPKIPIDMSGPYLGPVRQGPPDRDFMVISRLPPRYPYSAQRKGIEGWVRVSFLITEEGEVKDAMVIAAEPENIFNQAALHAMLKWRFKPRIEEGKPVAVRAEQVLTFKLDKNK